MKLHWTTKWAQSLPGPKMFWFDDELVFKTNKNIYLLFVYIPWVCIPLEGRRGGGSSGTGITGDSGPSDVGAGNKTKQKTKEKKKKGKELG